MSPFADRTGSRLPVQMAPRLSSNKVVNKIVSKRVRVARVVPVLFHPVAVIAVQSGLCTEPKNP